MENKRILIIDEYGFSRICTALLERAGYEVTISGISDLPGSLSSGDIGLIVTSYPYGAPVFDEIGRGHIPIIVLSDNIDENLIRILNRFESSYCMIKPIDYDKFMELIKEVIDGAVPIRAGYSIV